ASTPSTPTRSRSRCATRSRPWCCGVWARTTTCTCSCRCASRRRSDPTALIRAGPASGGREGAPMIIERLDLVDFRNYREASFALTAGTTVVVGDNGQGKTNLAEALAYIATLGSFRGAPGDALVRVGASSAIVRAQLRDDDGREVLIEAELATVGRGRVQVNRQRLARNRDLLGVVRVTVFSPDDLTLVKGGPADRRRYLDDTLVAL